MGGAAQPAKAKFDHGGSSETNRPRTLARHVVSIDGKALRACRESTGIHMPNGSECVLIETTVPTSMPPERLTIGHKAQTTYLMGTAVTLNPPHAVHARFSIIRPTAFVK